jgi:hypothetical protein
MQLYELPSGNLAALVYVVSLADLMIGMLLLSIVLLLIVQMWRSR